MILEISTILWSFILTLVIGVTILLTVKYHGRWTNDLQSGVQKFHQTATPRIGGLAIFVGVMTGFFVQADSQMRQDFLVVFISAALPFINGIREDLFKVGSVLERLLSIALASLVVILLTGVKIHQVHVPVLDQLLTIPGIAMIFTVFAVTGMTNAINIIDGFNGLASGVSLYICLFFAAIAIGAGDSDMAELCLILAIALLGFMLLNFPFGKIFLGDSGAYFIGFCLAWLALMLPYRNPNISPWAPLVIASYPITEVLYSVYRRSRAKVASTQADSEHLHSLIKTRLIRRFCFWLPAWLRNSMVSPLVWLSSIVMGLMGVIYKSDTKALMILFALFVLVYVFTHKVLINLPGYDEVGHRIDRNGN